MAFTMESTQTPKVKLRRLTLPRSTPNQLSPDNTQDLIEKNLQPLLKNNKKKVAQSFYYEQHPEHQSPLLRANKPPVHQRLGVKQIRLRRLVPLGTNTSSVLPKRRTFGFQRFQRRQPNIPGQFRRYQRNTPGNFKRQRLHRAYSAQVRLQKIRQQQQLQHTPIKLRRFNQGPHIPQATNLTVEVKNNNFAHTNGHPAGFTYDNSHYIFKLRLDPVIQAEIADLQANNPGTNGCLPPMTTITPAITGISISTRFSLL